MQLAHTAAVILCLQVWHVCSELTESNLNVDDRQLLALGGIRELLTKLLNVTETQGTMQGHDFGQLMDAVNITHHDFQKGLSTLAAFVEGRQHDSKSLANSLTNAMGSTNTYLKEISTIGEKAVGELTAVRYAMTNLTEVLARSMTQAPKADRLMANDNRVTQFVHCEPPYFKVLGSRGTECYTVHAEKMKWEAARKICQSEGSDLAQPKDLEALWRYLNENGLAGDYWVGGTDAEREGDWNWLSGEPINGPWHLKQPQGDGDCLDFLATKDQPVLNDYICFNAQGFVCQRYT